MTTVHAAPLLRVLHEESARLAPLTSNRLRRAKAAYTTRHVDLQAAAQLLTDVRPRVGDLVLARVVEVGQHAKLELAHSRRATMFPGDEIIVAYGNRYAPDQFEAIVPDTLSRCHLVAAGGVAASVVAAHAKMLDATTIEPIGLLVDHTGSRLTLAAGVLPVELPEAAARPLTIAVVGASMNSGKTTTAANLIRGLSLAGINVGAAKTTGTGAGGDVWLMSDAGAYPVYDFTNAGYPSTYLVGHDAVRDVFIGLTDRLAADGCQAVVLEIADGVFQDETAQLLMDPVFADRVDAVLFASYDALGASAGLGWLRDRGLEPVALSGVLCSSPLATREAEIATGHEVWDLTRLSDPIAARALFDRLGTQRDGYPVPLGRPA